MRILLSLLMLAFVACASAPAVRAQEPLTITIRNHRFEPTELKVPAGKRRAGG